MNLMTKYELSVYEEITLLNEKKPIWLVRNQENGQFYVKKKLNMYNLGVYQMLLKNQIKGIPRVLFLAEENQELVVIEEYIHGQNLKTFMEQKGPLDEKQTIKYMIDLCKIVKELHSLKPGIIHRDIKPSNIVLSQDGVVYLIDFNIARSYKEKEVEDTRLLGTQGFAAPEQCGYGQSDERTDVYGIGSTMNYLLTGSFPQQGIFQGKISPIIEKCTAMDNKQRYQKVDALLDALGRMEEKNSDIYGIDVEERSGKTILTRSLYRPVWYLPVGFRTGVIWKMILAIVYYVSLLEVVLVGYNSESVTPPGEAAVWWFRVTMYLYFVCVLFFLGNYGNIRYGLPLMKKGKLLHGIMSVVYLLLLFVIILFFTAILLPY